MEMTEIPYQSLPVPEMQANQEIIVRSPQKLCKYAKLLFQHFPFIATTIALDAYIATISPDNLKTTGCALISFAQSFQVVSNIAKCVFNILPSEAPPEASSTSYCSQMTTKIRILAHRYIHLSERFSSFAYAASIVSQAVYIDLTFQNESTRLYAATIVPLMILGLLQESFLPIETEQHFLFA